MVSVDSKYYEQFFMWVPEHSTMGVNYIHFIIGETLLLVEIFHFEGIFCYTVTA